MKHGLLFVLFAVLPPAVLADSIVATRGLRPGDVIAAEDLKRVPQEIPGALSNAEPLLGREAAVSIYAGRAVRWADTTEAAAVHRNQVVQLVFETAVMRIVTEGRALGRGAIGQMVPVMNLSSRTRVSGIVMADGSVKVLQ